ncbi:MAG: hypothetical protein ACXWF2_12540 [Usitatibacter sp.]
MKKPVRAALIAALACTLDSSAVSLNADGLGQALIFPYYTVNSAGGNPFNTYLSVVNHTADAKAIRVRLREGRLSKETIAFNVFLGPKDVWTGAVVPFASGARLISRDGSCTDPAFIIEFAPGSAPFLDLRTDAFTGANADGAGTETERVREVFVEVIEMATLTGASAAAVTPSAGAANCAAVRGNAAPNVAAPTGGLSGTLTLINVASGMDFTLNAEALADLGTRSFYRPATDPYPDFAAAEIDRVSLVVANGKVYRSVWGRPADAVSAVMMRDQWIFEYALDAASASLTDVVVTFPTRHLLATFPPAAPPFSRPATWSANCGGGQDPLMGEQIGFTYFSREEQTAVAEAAPDLPFIPGPFQRVCAAAAVAFIRNQFAHMPPSTGPTAVLGSITKGLGIDNFFVGSFIQNGWVRFSTRGTVPLTSLPTSTLIDPATGQVTAGSHQFSGLPVVGMWLRTLENGNLTCGGGVCQGNYGSAYSMRYHVGISP